MLIPKRKVFACMALILVTIIYASFSSSIRELHDLCVFSCIGIASSIIILFCVYKQITSVFIYYICLIIMHCGQFLMIAFGLPFPNSLRSSIALSTGSYSEMFAVRFTSIACFVIAFVFVLFYRTENNQETVVLYEEGTPVIRISSIGKVIIAFCIVLAVASDITRAISVSLVGYLKGFVQKNTILYYADMLLPLFIFLIIAVYKNNQKVIKTAYIMILFRSAFCAFFIGARSTAVLAIVMYTLAIIKLTDNNYIKEWISHFVTIIGIAGIIALPLSGVLRGDTIDGIGDFFKNYNPISYSLTEFGGTIENVKLSIGYYYDKEFTSSMFFESFLSIIPLSSFFFPSIVGGYGNAYASYINKRVGVLEGAGGAGGSLIGEAVFWFGGSFGGLLYLIIIAIIVVICSNKLSKRDTVKNTITNVGYLFMLYELFYQIRGTIYAPQTGIKLSIYFYIFYYFASKYLFVYKNN